MIDQLAIIQLIVVDVLRLEDPLEVEARRVWVLIIHPAPLLESLLDIRVTSRTYKYLATLINLELLLPSCQVRNVRENMLLRLVSL
jgi:hypothetical protein